MCFELQLWHESHVEWIVDWYLPMGFITCNIIKVWDKLNTFLLFKGLFI